MGDLYWGDNLNILRDYVDSGSVDLIYLDPPFNSNRNYNVLFKETSSHESDAQIEAFSDTWHWGEHAEETYNELVHGNHVPQRVSDLIVAMRSFIGSNDVMAYLVMMTIRLIELHRVLNDTGSIYLHCDPTASHYLKVVMDTIWGPKNFRNETIWKRSSAHSDTKQGMRRQGKIHDVILYYTKSDAYTWNSVFTPYDGAYLESEYRHVAPDGRRYKETDLTAAKPGGDTSYEWRVKRRAGDGSRWIADLDEEYQTPRSGMEYRGVRPYNGRFWGYSRENLMEFSRSGHLIHRETGMPRLMQFADEMPGVPLQDLWDDISPAAGNESLGYPTQKPIGLLERIVESSSNPGDLVLDPFCGCGTAIAAAEKLGRRWVGIDITHLAITLIVSRMKAMFPNVEMHLHGEPADIGGARALALQDRYDFQYWALTLVGARPVDDAKGKPKKGADQGIDGTISFLGENQKTPHRCIVQVKSGHVGSATIRDLKGTVEREKADLGLLITLEEPTGPMRTEALEAGYYHSQWMEQEYPRIQIITIGELLHGQQPRIPPRYNPYRLADLEKKPAQQTALFEREA